MRMAPSLCSAPAKVQQSIDRQRQRGVSVAGQPTRSISDTCNRFTCSRNAPTLRSFAFRAGPMSEYATSLPIAHRRDNNSGKTEGFQSIAMRAHKPFR
jgi:hypothetical protein